MTKRSPGAPAKPRRKTASGESMSSRHFELEVWGTAMQLFTQFGVKAEAEILDQREQAQSEGDHEAVTIWDSVLRALASLREAERLPIH